MPSSRTCCCIRAKAQVSTGPSDINALVEEGLNLAYHGARAEKQGFNISLERSLDPATGEVDVFPQDITRVLLNLPYSTEHGIILAEQGILAREQGILPAEAISLHDEIFGAHT
jgi:hypothetical protein